MTKILNDIWIEIEVQKLSLWKVNKVTNRALDDDIKSGICESPKPFKMYSFCGLVGGERPIYEYVGAFWVLMAYQCRANFCQLCSLRLRFQTMRWSALIVVR